MADTKKARLISQHALDVLRGTNEKLLVPVGNETIPDGRSSESRTARQAELDGLLVRLRGIKSRAELQVKRPLAVPQPTAKPLPKAGPLEPTTFLPAKSGEREGTQIYQRREEPKPFLGGLPGGVAKLVLESPRVRVGLRALELGMRPFQVGGEIIGTATSGDRGVYGRAAQFDTLVADVVKGRRSLRSALGELVELSKGRPEAEQLITQLPFLVPSEASAVLGRLAGQATKATGQAAKTYAKTAIETVGPAAGIPKAAVTTAARAAKGIEGLHPGVIRRGKQLVANPDNPDAAQSFVAELRRAADKAEFVDIRGQTPTKVRALQANARAARRDADRIEATIGTARKPRQAPVAPVAQTPVTVQPVRPRSRYNEFTPEEMERLGISGPAAKPAQATKPAAKEPWQMTYKEYSDSLTTGVVGGENAKHIRIVKQALKERKPVPPEVIAEYPEGTFVTARPVRAAEVVAPKAVTPKVISQAEAPLLGKAAAGGKPPVKPPVGTEAQLRLSIRGTNKQGGGFLISGRDTKNRQVRVFAATLQEAKQARENIRQGLEPLLGTEAEATANAVIKAQRKYRAALKRGEPGGVQRAKLELEQSQTRVTAGQGKVPPSQPPLPPRISPDGKQVPMPEFEAARNKLLRILDTSVRKSQKEINVLRSAERKKRFAVSRGATERALARGESPLPGIRAAQKGKYPVGELQLADRLTVEEAAVLRDRIYKTLGPELDWTSANIEEALHNLAFAGKVPTESELAWMGEIFGRELVDSLRRLRPKSAKAVELLLEAWNLPRALLASFDDSMVLRQGLHLIPEGKPVARALKAHIKAITKAGSEAIDTELRANPWYNHGRAHGLDLTSTFGAIGRHEEAFFGAGLAKKIPVLGKGVEVSERIAVAYLNKLRLETYAAHAQELTRMKAPYEAFKELAQNISILSGRATLGKAQGIAPLLNGMFFSARLNWARMQMPFRILRQVPKLDTPEGRHLAKMLAKDVYGMWAGIGGMVGLAAAAGVAAVELDPRSSDFGKMQVGTVRVDPWGGNQQFAVLMARIISGETKTTTTRQVIPQDMVDALGRFIESKAHPALGQLITIKEGKTFIGEDLTVKEFAKSWLPLFIQDIGEIVSGASLGVAAPLGVAAFFGMSTYNIPGVPSTVIRQFQDAVDAYNAIPTDSLDIQKGQVSRLEYRRKNPEADAALFLAGQTTSLMTSKAVQHVVSIVKEHGINPDDISGIAERKERQAKASEVGQRLERNQVDNLIRLLETGDGEKAPISQPTLTKQMSQEDLDYARKLLDRIKQRGAGATP